MRYISHDFQMNISYCYTMYDEALVRVDCVKIHASLFNIILHTHIYCCKNPLKLYCNTWEFSSTKPLGTLYNVHTIKIRVQLCWDIVAVLYEIGVNPWTCSVEIFEIGIFCWVGDTCEYVFELMNHVRLWFVKI